MREFHMNIDYDYPNVRKMVGRPGYDGDAELVPSRLMPEVELIARASYRLGAAEVTSGIRQGEARDASRRVEELEASLEGANNDKRIYRDRSENYSQEKRELAEKVEKLQAKLKPKKKKVVKKKAK